MLSTLLLSLAPILGPILPQDTSDSTTTGASSAVEDVEPRVFVGAVEAPTQPGLRSSSSVTRTSRFSVPSAHLELAKTKSPIRSLVSVRGMESNHVMGIGLVTGLAGTGDSGDAAKQLLQNLLLTRNINIDVQALSSKNIAVVRVEAELPAGIRPGQHVDVRASTIGDAKSLEGGTLAMTELTDITGRFVYATASGPVTVGGFSAGGENATATRNHVNVGTLPGGGKVEREIETSIVSEHGFLYLDIKVAHDTLGNIVNISEAVNTVYPGVAEPAADGKAIRVKMPADLPKREHVAFAHSILRREVVAENIARVIINERSGVIVMGGDVRLQPGIITHGNLTVTIAETPEASQPGPFSDGTTQELGRTELNVEEEDAPLVLVPGASTLQEVVDVLNVLGTTPRDMITILQAMSQSGTLLAEIREDVMDGINLTNLPPSAEIANLHAQSLATPQVGGDHAVAAEQFEALIATMLVKEMRQSLDDGFFGSGPGSDTFGGWLDKSIGDSLAGTWELDLAGLVKTNLDTKQARLDGALTSGAGGEQ